MANLQAAVNLQKNLLEEGYKSIALCDIQDDGLVTISYYVLSKDEGIYETNDPCQLNGKIDLNSEKAVQIIDRWINQISIYPDPSSI